MREQHTLTCNFTPNSRKFALAYGQQAPPPPASTHAYGLHFGVDGIAPRCALPCPRSTALYKRLRSVCFTGLNGAIAQNPMLTHWLCGHCSMLTKCWNFRLWQVSSLPNVPSNFLRTSHIDGASTCMDDHVRRVMCCCAQETPASASLALSMCQQIVTSGCITWGGHRLVAVR